MHFCIFPKICDLTWKRKRGGREPRAHWDELIYRRGINGNAIDNKVEMYTIKRSTALIIIRYDFAWRPHYVQLYDRQIFPSALVSFYFLKIHFHRFSHYILGLRVLCASPYEILDRQQTIFNNSFHRKFNAIYANFLVHLRSSALISFLSKVDDVHRNIRMCVHAAGPLQVDPAVKGGA